MIIALILFFSGCAAKKELQKDNSRLEAELSIKQNENIMLTYEIEKLSKEIEKLKESLKEVNLKYENATRTADYYFQKGCNSLNDKDYKTAYKYFHLILDQYPNSNLINTTKEKLKQLENISNENIKALQNKIQNLGLKEKISIIRHAKRDDFFSFSDSIKLDNNYQAYVAKHEEEKHVSIKEDKMQSCYFIETTRNTLQNTWPGVGLKFEIYIVKPYAHKKYFRLRTEYQSSDWLFYEKVIIRGSNDVQIEVATKYPDKKTDSRSSGVTEWSDNYISSDLEKKILKISESDNVSVRYVGNYVSEITLNEEQRLAFKEIVQHFIKK